MTELPDRLLRDALRPGAPATTSNVCVDAEALAAWADRTMSRAARAAFEIHAADCERCQALMAAMARTEPPPMEPVWWRRAVFSWLMPLAAATAAIVIVVSLSITERRAPAPEAARQESAAAAAPALAQEKAAPAPTAPPASAPAAPQASASAIPDSRRTRAIPPAVRRQDEPKDAAGLSAAKTELRANADPIAPPRPAPPPPAPPAAPPVTANARDVAAPAPAAVAPTASTTAQAAPAGGAAAGAASPTAFRAEEARSKAVADRVAVSRMMEAKMRIAIVLIASPVRESQWRIVGAAVEHTDDGGVTWQAQALGVDVPVRAGAAPAARVCWLAGASGLVLLTTDGTHWRRIVFPEPVDLVAVEATDASHATVTATTGRRFSTGDGGQTWTSR